MTILIERPTLSPERNGATPPRRSWLLDFLPAMYAGDDLMKRFLLIFEDTLMPLQQMLDNTPYYFNPLTTSPEMISWLASWVNLVLDESWSLEKRRRLIYSASDLYSRRGTKRGLTEYLKLYTEVEPEISEYVDGMTLGPETYLGINTRIAGRERHSFTVTLRLPQMSDEERAYKEASIRRIIESEKPAHTAYRLILLANEPPSSNDSPPPDPKQNLPGLDPDDNTVTKVVRNGKVSGSKSTSEDKPTRRVEASLSDSQPAAQENDLTKTDLSPETDTGASG